MALDTAEHDPAADDRDDAASDPAAAYRRALVDLCADVDAPVDSRFTDARDPGGRLHYLVVGDGANGDDPAADADAPPLVCLHGLGSTAGVWAPLFDALAARFTLYVPERPGRGLSDPVDYGAVEFRRYGVDYVVDLLDAVGLAAPTVLANSLGGFQALALAIDHPGRVSRLCLPGAPAGLSRTPPAFFRLLGLPIVGDWIAERTRPTTVAESRAAYRRLNVVDASAVPDALLELELAGERLPGRTRSLRSLIGSLGSLRAGAKLHARYDLRPALSDLAVRTRFVWGTEDYFWSPDVAQPVVAAMPDADLRVLDGHGHVPWLEPGDEATAAILDGLSD